MRKAEKYLGYKYTEVVILVVRISGDSKNTLHQFSELPINLVFNLQIAERFTMSIGS